MTRIAIISLMGGSPWGGSEYLWAAVAEKALSQGHTVFISLYDWSIDHPIVIQLKNQRAHLLIRPRFPSPESRLRRITKKLISYIPFVNIPKKSDFQSVKDCQPDIILISQGDSYALVGFPDLINILKSLSAPYVILNQYNSVTVNLDGEARITALKLFNQARTVAFVSQQNLKLAEHHLAHSLPNAVVVQNPVNLKDINLVPWPEKEILSFGCVARLETNIKGQDILFQVLSLSSWQNRNWECRLYGAGPDLAYLKSLADYYKISDRIQFMGHVNDIRAIWAHNHLLVLPSRGEGTLLSLVEAMLCGRPAVVTDVGGNAEWVEEGQTGFIAETATVKSFDAALTRAWEVQQTWQALGRKAHTVATARFDPLPGQQILDILLALEDRACFCNIMLHFKVRLPQNLLTCIKRFFVKHSKPRRAILLGTSKTN